MPRADLHTMPASAATVYTFSLSNGQHADPGSIQAFSFDPLGAGGTLSVLKELDAFTPVAFTGLINGTSYPGATFSAFDGVVAPGTRLFRYDLTTVLFTEQQFPGTQERFSVTAEMVTLTRGPAIAPEPATLLLLGLGAAVRFAARVKGLKGKGRTQRLKA